MARKNFIVISQTIEPENGMMYAVGFCGTFSTLKRALNAANAEIKEMGAPDEYALLPSRRTSVITTDENGKYSENGAEFAIQITLVETEVNRIYTNNDKLV